MIRHSLMYVQLSEYSPNSSEGLSCDDLQTLPPTNTMDMYIQ